LGRISALVEQAEAEDTPLEKRLDALGQRLIWLTLGIAVLLPSPVLSPGETPF
jgi:P-type Ca2+ transporter type 2C